MCVCLLGLFFFDESSSYVQDAYDGEGTVPAHLSTPAFLDDCAAVTAPGGVVVANIFNGVKGSKVRANVEAFAAGGGASDSSTPL